MTHDMEDLAKWMIRRGFATGHGSTMDDLIAELDWQIDDILDRNKELMEANRKLSAILKADA